MIDLSPVRVVLVRPHFDGNLGSVARAMANFGCRDLVLVDPLADPKSVEAKRMATHGLSVLESARTMPTVKDALADCVATLATGGLNDGLERKTVSGSARNKLPFLINSMSSGPVAIVFGPEPHGLTTAEVSLCHGMVHIATSPDCPSINLSHAVAICLYEMSELTQPSESLKVPAAHADLDRLFTHLRVAFEAVHYIFGLRGDQLMHAFRHVISRAQPTPQEVRLLHGLARQMLWVAGRAGIDPKNPPSSPEEESV